MKQVIRTIIVLAALLAGLLGVPRVTAAPWVTAYYPDYRYASTPLANVDLSNVTDLVWFALAPTNTGGLQDISSTKNMLSNAQSVVTAGHKAGTKVLLCIGGGGTDSLFAATFSAGDTNALVSSIVSDVSQYGFDGADIDDEGINDGSGDANNSANYAAFIQALRSALPANKIITIAAQTYYPTAQYNTIKNYVNQINIMTYDLAGPYEQRDSSNGYYTWYTSALYAGGYTVPGTSTLLPGAAGIVSTFQSDGIPSSELAIGAPFYGYDWQGATNIEQAFTFAFNAKGNCTNCTSLGYADIISTKYNASYYHHDTSCGAAYLGLTNMGEFVSYDDANVIADKFSFIITNGLGGIVCYEIGQQYTPGGTTLAAKNPLLTAVDRYR